MPRYYCDYCDTYLTHDSPSVRKQHNAGYKHKANVRSYYQQFEEQQTQSFIDQKVKEHLGQTAAFHQHLTALQSGQQRPRIPVLPPPTLPVPGSSQALHNQLLSPAVRPPVLPRPTTGPPGNVTPLSSAPALRPPGAPLTLPPGIAQPNGLPRPPALNSPAATGLRPATPTSTSPPMANGLMSALPHSGAPSTYQNQQPNSMTTSGAYATYSYTSPTSFS